jgi:hypothetical protein
MFKTARRSIALGCSIVLAATRLFAADIPKPLKSRFVVGDPVWRELLIRDDLKTQYEKCWQTAVTTLLENNFDVATMDKDSGYIRTTENTNVVVLNGDWVYKVQISIKYVYEPADPNAKPPTLANVQKVRVQVAGEVAETSKGTLKHYFRGYDQVVLQNLFQDLQAKLGPR